MERKVSLTFDDGPNPPFTDQILKLLKEYSVPATFFVCGANIKRNFRTVVQAGTEGHLFGNHTFTHLRRHGFFGFAEDQGFFNSRLELSTYEHEILDTQQLITAATRQNIKLFRPPFGILRHSMRTKLEGEGYKIVMPTVVGFDWIPWISVNRIVGNIVPRVKDGSIILLHDGKNIEENVDRSKTVAATKIIIEELLQKGFTFKTPLELGK